MYLRDVLSALARRWYLTAIIVLLAIGSSALVLSEVGPTYQTKGSVFLVPPVDPENPDTNRLLGLGGLGQARDVLVRALDSDTLHAALVNRYPDAKYEVTPDYTTSAPVLIFTVDAKTPESAAALRQDLVGRVSPMLQSIQEDLDIAKDSQLVALTINAGDEPQTLQKQRIRVLLVVLAGVLGISLAVVLLLDRWLLRRRSRASAVSAEPASESEDEARLDEESTTESILVMDGSPPRPEPEQQPLEHSPRRHPVSSRGRSATGSVPAKASGRSSRK